MPERAKWGFPDLRLQTKPHLLPVMVGENIFEHASLRLGKRWAVRIAAISAGVFLVLWGMETVAEKLALMKSDAASLAVTGLLVTVVLGYAVLLAIPFVPGVEIAVAVLMLKGADAAPIVYLATVGGLLLAFVVGQYIPMHRLIRLCRELSLNQLADMLERIDQTPRYDRLERMRKRLPGWLAAPLCNYRYLTIAALLNLPGNVALGGGGGIMLLTGLSRLYRLRWMVLTVALAALPVPFAVWLWGGDILG